MHPLLISTCLFQVTHSHGPVPHPFHLNPSALMTSRRLELWLSREFKYLSIIRPYILQLVCEIFNKSISTGTFPSL
ncbi:hypothetical protein TSAR_009822 [Trichomalopsis sarcophagae]|uniref:Uncharacterized protein n=1 Tax=Trichomalopsis sarcophagae TaxID=543379 RepID=A0A232EP23_9HYME|nr:hypothetical protein TSAR_009822 [Trichomalopsis sarcophagae]